MANRNAPFGLRPVGHLTGGEVRPNRYRIASAYGQSIYSGDLVCLSSTNREVTYGHAGTDAPFVGVFAGVWYTPTSAAGVVQEVFSPYWPASTVTKGSISAECLVYDDPKIIFTIQADAALAATDIGREGDIAYTAGSTLSGVSKTQLGVSTLGTDKNLYVYDIVEAEDNVGTVEDSAATNQRALVLINEHVYSNVGLTSIIES